MSDQPDLSRLLARNTVWNYLSFAVNVIVNVTLFPYAVSRLGQEAAGIWLLLSSIAGYMGLLQLGIVPAVIQFVAAHSGRGELQEQNRAASTAMALLVGLAGLIVVSLPFVPLIVGTFDLTPGLRSIAAPALQIGVLAFAVQLPGFTFNAFLAGAQRQDRCGQAWVVSLLLRFVMTVIVLESGGGLVALLLAELAVSLVTDVLLGVLAFSNVPGLRLSPRLVDGATARALGTFGGMLVISNLCTVIVQQTDRLVIAAVLPLGMVTVYAAAWKLHAFALAIPTTLLFPLMPAAALLGARNEHDELRRLFLRMNKFAIGLAWPLGFSLSACAAWVLQLWVGPEFAAHALVAQILVAAFLILSYNQAAQALLTGLRQVRPLVMTYQLPQAALNLGLSVVLARSMGLTGVALGTLVPPIILQPILQRLLHRTTGISPGEVFRQSAAPTLIPAVIVFTPLLVVYLRSGPLSGAVPLTAGLCTMAYAVAFWNWSLTGSERASLQQFMTGVLPLRRRPLETVESEQQ